MHAEYIPSSVGHNFITVYSMIRVHGHDETVLFAEYSFLVRFILQTVTGQNMFDWHNLSNPKMKWSANFGSEQLTY